MTEKKWVVQIPLFPILVGLMLFGGAWGIRAAEGIIIFLFASGLVVTLVTWAAWIYFWKVFNKAVESGKVEFVDGDGESN